jgi:hypothetical protein
MKAELRTMLSTTNKTRHDAVTELHEGIQTAQRELAEDLASAGRTWRAFAASR